VVQYVLSSIECPCPILNNNFDGELKTNMFSLMANMRGTKEYFSFASHYQSASRAPVFNLSFLFLNIFSTYLDI